MLILIMSVSGSMIFLAVLLCAVLGKRVFSPAWIYNMLRLDLIFFCLPLPKYNSGYKSGLLRILGISRQWDMVDIAAENIIGIDGSGMPHISLQTYIIVIWVVWVCGLLLAVIVNLRRYRRIKVVKENRRVSRSDYMAIFDKVKEEVGIKKRVTLLCADETDMICTMGVFRKYVIIPESGLTEEEIYYSLKHELIHAKRSDVAWRYLGLLVVLLHWFNPLAYLYFYAMSVCCEQSCDAIVVQNLDKAARKRYGNLIINMAQVDGLGRWKYRTNLSGSKKMIERRLINMLRSGKPNKMERVASLLLGALWNKRNMENGCFADTLFRKTNGGLDSYAGSERNRISDCGVYGRVFQTGTHRYNTVAIKEVETERYSIMWKPDGHLFIYDKERGGKEAFGWTLNKNDVQIDEKTGLKFLINDLGCGLFNMVVVDEELEQGLKEALDVSELYEKPLVNFSVQQDQKTGIRYITPNGFESSGGQIIMDKEAREKLDSLAKEYLSQYPNLVHSYEEAWFHATFEVRGLTKRTSGGIMQISPNSISFLDKDGINSWVCIFDPERWKEVKEKLLC